MKFPEILFSDFDGTLTDLGEIGPIFFDLLDLLNERSSELVIVTGRSLSWGHFLLSHFPLKAVIVEGGGALCTREEGKIHNTVFATPTEITQLNSCAKKLLNDFPKLRPSADSLGRLTDMAFELEEVRDSHAEIVQAIEDFGGETLSSNIHLHMWFGDRSKAFAMDKFLEANRPDISRENTLFAGDSLNDESAFEHWPHSIGVSNIRPFLKQMKFHPKQILEGPTNSEIHGLFSVLRSLD